MKKPVHAASRNISLRTCAIALLLLTIFIRLPSLFHPRAVDDESVYSLVANAIADGGKPYVDAVERKPPLLFWTYAAIVELGGKFNWPFLHVVALLWVMATMAGLYLLGLRLFNPLTGLFAAFFYSLYQPWLVFDDLSFNGEMVMNLPIAWAWVIAFSHSRSRVRPELFLSGMLLGAAFLLKQPAAIAAVPLGIYFLLPAYQKSRGLTFLDGVAQAGVFTAGFFGTLALTAVILSKQGILSEGIYWTVTDHSVPIVFWGRAFFYSLAFVGACLPMVIGAAISCRDRDGYWRAYPAERMALCALVIVSAMGAAAGGRFYFHYYIQLVPPLALLAAPVFADIFSTAADPRPWLLKPRLLAVWLGLTVIAFSISHWIGETIRRPAREVGQYLRTHSDPADRLFVWGQAAGVYVDARLPPACRYVVTFPLTGYIFGGISGIDTHYRIVPGSWEKLDQDFNAHPPEFIVEMLDGPKNTQYPIREYPVLAHWLQRYEPVARFPEGVIYRAVRPPGTNPQGR